MSRIAFIAPDKHLYLQGKKIIHELGLDNKIDIYLSRLEKATVLAKSLENKDVDVIISRGGTARLIITSKVRIPVVEISISGQELAQLFQEAKKVTGLAHPKVFMPIFHNPFNDIEVLANILDIELTLYPFEKSEDIPKGLARISQLKPSDADIVIGGKKIIILAAELGFKTLLIRSGRLTLQMAILEAQKIVLACKIGKENAQEFKTLVDYSTEGIISINRKKVIKVFNPQAEHLLNHSAIEMLGKDLDSVLDFIDTVPCLKDGQEIIGQTIHFEKSWLTFNIAPISIDEVVIGAIITFQDITRIQEMEARIRNDVLAKNFIAKYKFTDILGTSAQIIETKRIAQEIASVDATVLISGETGTGKELFAQSIHNESQRKNGPFVALNCAALPPSLLESELFGYVEGAFTGATKKGKPGLFEMAHRGTIFLDEISEMDKYGQSRLLRVLQEREVMRLGDNKNIPIDVRIIAASNQNLANLTKERLFRQDLFYRLKVLTLDLPSLRKRDGDIQSLARHFLDHFNRQHRKHIDISEGAYDHLGQYSWFGNVRELMYFIERLVIIAKERYITEDVIQKFMIERECEQISSGEVPVIDNPPLFSEVARITAALAQSNSNISRAAKLLSIDRSTLYRKLKIHGIKTK
jgi:PAS domain S-box-containing protein